KKVLVIGWKAGDPFLLEKLKIISEPVDLIVVSGSKDGAKRISSTIKKYLQINGEVLFEGFSNFIDSEECNNFFSDKTIMDAKRAKHLEKVK
ncbi:MAG: hypothetical protein AABY22_11735, partial [Nanoarchaeota archaeon]